MILDEGSPEAGVPGGAGPGPVGLFALVPPEAVVVGAAVVTAAAAAVVVVVVMGGGAPPAPGTVGEGGCWVVNFFVALRGMSDPVDFVEEDDRTLLGLGSKAHRSFIDLDLVRPRDSLGFLNSVEVGGGGTDPVDGRGSMMGSTGGRGADVSITSGVAGLVRSISSLKTSETLTGRGAAAAASLGRSLIRLKRKLS